jgi:asparagine synthase (glutamine-hydrolysing)
LFVRAQVVTAEMWAKRAERFPEHTPRNKEYYLLRSIFEKHYPGRPAMLTVPQVRAPAMALIP